MFDFFYKPRFYFVNTYILNILRGDYFSARYPSVLFESVGSMANFRNSSQTLLQDKSSLRPVVYYDFKFYSFLRLLIDGETNFFVFKPRTFCYYFFGGFFLRFIWTFGAARRFLPAYARRDPFKLFGFYDVGLTPLAVMMRIYYMLASFFGYFNATHYAFNKNFFAYQPNNFFPYYSSTGYSVADHAFLNKVFFFRRGFSFSLVVLLLEIFCFPLVIFFHFFVRGFTWVFLAIYGRLWFKYISYLHYPTLSFEKIWSIFFPTSINIEPGYITEVFFIGGSLHDHFKSLRFTRFLGLTQPQLYEGLPGYHYRHAQQRALNEVFSSAKFSFISPFPKRQTLVHSALSLKDLVSILHVRHSDQNFSSLAKPGEEDINLFSETLSRRAFFFMSRYSSTAATLMFFFLKTLQWPLYCANFLLRFCLVICFGPSFSIFPALTHLKLWFKALQRGASGFWRRFLDFAFTAFSFFRFYTPVFSSLFSFIFVRFTHYYKLAIVHEYFLSLRRLFHKFHNYKIYEGWVSNGDFDVLSPDRESLDSPEIEAEDAYDTDFAEGDTRDGAFYDADIYNAEEISGFDLDVSELNNSQFSAYSKFTGPLADRFIPLDFFEDDVYDIEQNISSVWFFSTIVPNLYEFFQRDQYKHMESELSAHNDEEQEDSGYDDEQLPTDYDSGIPAPNAANRLLSWGTNYQSYLNKWQAGALQNKYKRLPDFVRGGGLPFLPADAFLKLTKSDWTELTYFVDSLATGRTRSITSNQPLTKDTFDTIWSSFEDRCTRSPELIFKRLITAKAFPKSFENFFVYPRGQLFFTSGLGARFFKFLYGVNYKGANLFKFFQQVSFTVSDYRFRFSPVFFNDKRLTNLLDFYFKDYITKDNFAQQLGSFSKNRYNIVVVSAYLRKLALEDFSSFKANADKLKGFWVFNLVEFFNRYELKPLTIVKRLTPPATIYSTLRAFFVEPGTRTFFDLFYQFVIRRPNQSVLNIISGDNSTTERTKADVHHPQRGVFPYMFFPSYFSMLFSDTSQLENQNGNNALGKFWSFKNDLPKPMREFPRADDLSVYRPELRSSPYQVNLFPNDYDGWQQLLPFFDSFRLFFHDPFLINLCLPPQFDWLDLENPYVWDLENDLEQLDMYDEFSDIGSDFFIEDDEDLAPVGPYEGLTGEEDLDALSSDPDFSDVSSDWYGEAVTDDDAERSDEEHFDSEHPELNHAYFYGTDAEEYSYEHYEEEEWYIDDVNLFTDSSIPLSRLFFGGLRPHGSFPATDPRMFLGSFSEFQQDSSLNLNQNFLRAKVSSETTGLVPAGVLRNNNFKHSNVFFFLKVPVVSFFIKCFVYTYVLLKDFVYSYILFQFYWRPEVRIVRFHFQALNHYFRWSSFYGNKYYFYKFSSALTTWLEDFEKYATAAGRVSGYDNFNFYGYFPYQNKKHKRTSAFYRFLASMPFASFWHIVDNSKLNDEEDPYLGDLSSAANYDHPDKWTLYERQRFSVLVDLPARPPFHVGDASPDEWATLDNSPHYIAGQEDEFSEYDDALMFSYSLDVDFTGHLETFNSKAEIFISALLDLLDLVRDYSLYGSRIFFSYFIYAPFHYWVLYSESFWLKLSFRIGLWVNLVRYFFSAAVYISVVVYTMFVIPRVFYFFFGTSFSTTILLILNSFFSLFVILFFASFCFSPVYNYFRNLSGLDKQAFLYLLFFIFFQHVLFGYQRTGTLNIASLDSVENHADTTRVRHELNYDVPQERTMRHDRWGPNIRYNMEVDGTYTPIDLEYIVYNTRSRQSIFPRVAGGFPEHYKRSQHFEYSYSRAPLDLTTLFYALKTHIFKIRSRVFTGYRYIDYRSNSFGSGKKAGEIFELTHRPNNSAVLSAVADPAIRELHREANLVRTANGYAARMVMDVDFLPQTITRRTTNRTNRVSYFSTRYRGVGKTTWTPFPYDFRVKTLDHGHEIYSKDITFGKKLDLSYNRYGYAPRDRNLFIRMPNFSDMVSPGDIFASNREGVLYKWPRSGKQEGSRYRNYKSNSTPEDIFGISPSIGPSSLFSRKRQQPKPFYRKNFQVYAYGDWNHRRDLLNSAYSFKNYGQLEKVLGRNQYYYFIRKRAADAHFADLYSRNLRDFLLFSKPDHSYAFADIYAPNDKFLRIAKRPLDQMSPSIDPYNYRALNQFTPYANVNDKSVNFLSSVDSTVYSQMMQRYADRSGKQGLGLEPGYMTFIEAKHLLSRANSDSYSVDLAPDERERRLLLGFAKALRSVQQQDRILHITKHFSNFHFYKQLISSNQYPREALDTYLSFEGSLVPKISWLGNRPAVTDPYYQKKLLRSSSLSARQHEIPDAYGPRSIHSGFTAAPTYAFAQKNLTKTGTYYDPISLYNLPNDYKFYSFLPGAHSSTTRFSNIFDNIDVYDSTSPGEFAEFNRSPNLHSELLRGVASYEDYLDDFLTRHPANFSYGHYLGKEPELFGMYPVYERPSMAITYYERYPLVYDSLNVRKYATARAHQRLGAHDVSLFFGDARKSRSFAIAKASKGRSRRFQIFAEFLTGINDYNQVQGLKNIYFSDFLKLSKVPINKFVKRGSVAPGTPKLNSRLLKFVSSARPSKLDVGVWDFPPYEKPSVYTRARVISKKSTSIQKTHYDPSHLVSDQKPSNLVSKKITNKRKPGAPVKSTLSTNSAAATRRAKNLDFSKTTYPAPNLFMTTEERNRPIIGVSNWLKEAGPNVEGIQDSLTNAREFRRSKAKLLREKNRTEADKKLTF